MAPQRPTPLRQAIDARGYRHCWLAARVGVTPGHFSQVVNGRRSASRHMRRALCHVLDASEGELFAASDPTPQPASEGGSDA